MEKISILELDRLKSEELIKVIEEAHGILNKHLPLSPSSLKCPKCGHQGYFRIEAYWWIDWEPHEITAEANHEPEWCAVSTFGDPTNLA